MSSPTLDSTPVTTTLKCSSPPTPPLEDVVHAMEVGVTASPARVNQIGTSGANLCRVCTGRWAGFQPGRTSPPRQHSCSVQEGTDEGSTIPGALQTKDIRQSICPGR